jgi:hypothetical protein
MTAIMYHYQYLGGSVLCPECSEILTEVRRPFLAQAFDAAVAEINQYHKDNPVAKGAPVLTVVDKGGVH